MAMISFQEFCETYLGLPMPPQVTVHIGRITGNYSQAKAELAEYQERLEAAQAWRRSASARLHRKIMAEITKTLAEIEAQEKP